MIIFDNFISGLLSAAESIPNKQRALIISSYKLELVNTLKRVSEIKNLIYRERPAQLKDIFVEPSLKHEGKIVSSDHVFHQFAGCERIIIRGSAGLGKSVLLKYFCLNHVHKNASFAPLFIELRKVRSEDADDIVKAIHRAYHDEAGNVSISDLKNSLRNRDFSLILDGYDEVSDENKPLIEAAILKFSSDYPACPIIVSGRADETFYSWEEFCVYDVCPMTQSSTVALISKLDYNIELKEKFIKDAVPKLFSDRDSSFIQTPLLAILMLLTYEIFAEVPSQMHLFYSHAFETLLRGHDVTKSQFRRKLVSGLSEEDFKRLFAAFCAVSYSDKVYQFTDESINSYLSEALSSCGISADSRKILEDLVLSVCVMQREGLEYSFVHRSFQEYFTAAYLRDSPIGVVTDFLEAGYSPSRENVLPMLFGMDRDRLEKEWCHPALVTIRNLTQGETIEDRLKNLYGLYWTDLGFDRTDKILRSISHPGGELYRKYAALEVIYAPMFSHDLWWFDSWSNWTNRSSRIANAYRKGIIDEEVVTMENKENVGGRFEGSNEKFDVHLNMIKPSDYKRLGLVTIGKKFLDRLDNIHFEVDQRVKQRDNFSSRLFRPVKHIAD